MPKIISKCRLQKGSILKHIVERFWTNSGNQNQQGNLNGNDWQGPQNMRQSRNTQNLGDIICHRCGMKGHKRFECRRKQCQKCGFQRSCDWCNITCFKCNRKGHRLHECFSNEQKGTQNRERQPRDNFDRRNQQGQNNHRRNETRNSTAVQQDIHLPAQTEHFDQRIIPSPTYLNY